ncbi:hypothetical protein GCM10007205_20800 [Oxalicibacterium flavum]|uniref:Outer membrane protein beta-barrel domain-containing protein n=1 Tax=Oxalicibacterium flavum TaxID=179467 RepID=A0A8J2UNA0_9BURK|nr:outer membrane beta-barrel protein [Oxalicibacterium flavum]GGC11483.1 hypothetical protein GCM10007205_20800 [Oxalicibacterium flavum]
MKKQLSLLAFGIATALPLSAFAEGAYVGVNAGRANHKVHFDDGESAKDNATGYKLYAGYNFNQNFGVEGGYTHLGKYSDSWDDGAGDSGSETIKGRALYVAATGTLPLSEQFSLFGKLGVTQNRVKASIVENGNFASASKSRTTGLFGVGASFHFSRNLAAVLEYENYGNVKFSDVKLKANLVSIGLRYAF